jgi:hypothetical protein
MNKPICSIKRFERMCVCFKKYAQNQIERNPHTNKIPFLFYGDLGFFNVFDKSMNKIINKFKSNRYKTKSAIVSDIFSSYYWLSYTIENDLGKRYYGKDFSDKFIVFKIHVKVGNYRKKRIAYWKVKLNN